MSNQSNYPCPICGADNMRTDFTDGFKWGRAYCNSCDCGGPEVHTGYEESLDAPWRTEARKQFADVANEYANKPLADDINVARSPWVKTSDRLPEEREGDHVLVATYDADRRQWIRWVTSRGLVKSCSQIEWWMPIPTLPEAAK